MTLGTQEEAEAGVGHAAQRGVMTVEGIAAPAQDVAAALRNRDGMWMIDLDQVVVGMILTTVATAPLPTGPGRRAGRPWDQNLLMLPQPRGRARNTTAGAAAAQGPAALMETKDWFHTEM